MRTTTWSEATLARLIGLQVLVRPGEQRPLSREQFDALEVTPEGVPLLLRSGQDAYKAALGQDWDGDIEAGAVSVESLKVLSHYTPQCDDPAAPVRTALAELLAAHAPRDKVELAVELGCSAGPDVPLIAAHAETVLAFDSHPVPLRWLARRVQGRPMAVIRRIRGRDFSLAPLSNADADLSNVVAIAANALDPPLRAECADLVVAMNILDVVSSPLNLLGQIDAVLKPGGLAVVASPFHWQDAITPAGQQLPTLYPTMTGPEAVAHVLAGGEARLPHLRLDVVEARDGVPWVVQDHGRCTTHYTLWVAAVRKRHLGAESA